MKLAFVVAGNGPPLVLVHGWGLGPHAWDCIVPRLAERFTVHVVALPGYGCSAPATDATMDALADALAASLPAPAAVCGWSLGAMVALHCAARHPTQVSRLILVGANACFVSRDDWPDALPMETIDEFERELESDAAGLLRNFCSLINHGDEQARIAIRALRSCIEDGLPANVASLRAGLDLLRTADLRPIAKQVKHPTLLLHGAADSLMPLAGARRLTALLSARMAIFAGAAHAPFASQPADFVEQVGRFAGAAT